MSQAKAGDTVRVHYTGKLDDDTEFDTSAGRDPVEFALGSGRVIPGLDKAVEGMTVGENKSARIPAEEGYGPRQEYLIQEVPKSALPDDLDPEVGMPLQAKQADGQVMKLVVTAVTEESITVDGNHPLAGQALNFHIELVEII
ncbi:MAG: peptidylprolyl isomerase [Terriglobia bacterium]